MLVFIDQLTRLETIDMHIHPAAWVHRAYASWKQKELWLRRLSKSKPRHL